MERIGISLSKSKKAATYLKGGKVFRIANCHIKINNIKITALDLSEIGMQSV